MRRGEPAPVGIGLRPPHYQDVLDCPPEVDVFEVVTENFLGLRAGGGGRPVEVLEAVRSCRPVRLHGVSLNVGSVDPLSKDYLLRLRALADRIQPECISDHLCWTGAGWTSLHDLLPLPFTEEALTHVAARVDAVQVALGRRVLLENVSSYISFKHSSMSEWEFLAELSQRTGCGLLLDVNNVYVSAHNHAFAAHDFLAGLPTAHVAQFHLGGHTDGRGLLVDTHDQLVTNPVWDLFREAVRRFGQLPTVIEWDARLPPLATLLSEAGRARAILREFDNESSFATAG